MIFHGRFILNKRSGSCQQCKKGEQKIEFGGCVGVAEEGGGSATPPKTSDSIFFLTLLVQSEPFI